jgi:branched-chain amino acid transport system permease protein
VSFPPGFSFHRQPERRNAMLELFFSQLLNGLIIGQVYALIAIGFSLVFGVSNLINFAQGALLMLGAFFAFSGVTAFGLPLPAAALAAVVLVVAISIAMEQVALRPLENGPYIAPVLSTLAISMIIDQLAEIIWSPEGQAFSGSYAEETFYFGRAYVTSTDILIFALGACVAVTLTLFLSGTWSGRLLRATAQDREAAAQLGVYTRDVRRFAFGLAGALGAVSGILIALYFKSVFPQMGLPFGLKGFAAALLGGLTSIPGAALGGLLLGSLETLASAYLGEGYRDLAAFTLLLVFLRFRPQGLLGDQRLDTLGGAGAASGAMPCTSPLASPSSRRVQYTIRELPPYGFLILAALAALLPLITRNTYIIQAVVFALIFSLLAVGETIAAGSIGVISIGHAAFYGIGAYTAAILGRNWGWPAEAVLPATILLTAATAVIGAFPLLKLNGHTASLGTLALGQIVYLIFMTWIPVTRGPMGFPNIPAPQFAILGNLRLGSIGEKLWLTSLLAGIALFFAQRIVGSSIGTVWRGIREDRLAAHVAGLPVARYTLTAFAVSGALMGTGGALFAYVQGVISPDSFTVQTSMLLLVMAVLGGLGNVTGAVLAGFLLTFLAEILRPFAEWRMVVYGLILLLMLRFRPYGLLGAR